MDYLEKNSENLLKNLPNLSIDQMAELVSYHNNKYFVDNAPEISDEAFDKLAQALRLQDPHNKSLVKLVEKVIDQVAHKTPMLSLDKCYDDASFFKWQQKINEKIIACPKIDGVACSLVYDQQGNLIRAATRGNGYVGENILQNILVIESIPKKLNQDILAKIIIEDNLEIRGEIFMPVSIFNQQFAANFSNPRNLAAGAIKLKNSQKSADYKLNFLAYDMLGDNLETLDKKFFYIEKLKFLKLPFLYLEDNKVNEILNYFLNKRENFDFETDGIVFKANLITEQIRLGVTAHHPKYAIAYKFQSEVAQTNLINIEWNVARTGAITPVAIFSPVTISQASIARASLHNLGQFYKHEFKTNSLIEVSRRGGVIPQVERVLSSSGELFLPPSACPACGGEVITKEDFLYCKDTSNCLFIKKAAFIYFCKVMGMEGFGPKIIEKLVDEKLVINFANLYELDLFKLMQIDRMGEVLANKLLQEINKAKNIELATFLQALGLQEVADNISSIVANNFKSLDKIRQLKEEDLSSIFGIGPRIASSLVSGLSGMGEQIDELLKFITIKPVKDNAESFSSANIFYKKSVLFTGTLSLDRKMAQKMVKDKGGSTPSSVSKNLDFLVVGGNSESSKQKEARKLIEEGVDIKILTEEDFLRMIDED